MPRPQWKPPVTVQQQAPAASSDVDASEYKPIPQPPPRKKTPEELAWDDKLDKLGGIVLRLIKREQLEQARALIGSVANQLATGTMRTPKQADAQPTDTQVPELHPILRGVIDEEEAKRWVQHFQTRIIQMLFVDEEFLELFDLPRFV